MSFMPRLDSYVGLTAGPWDGCAFKAAGTASAEGVGQVSGTGIYGGNRGEGWRQDKRSEPGPGPVPGPGSGPDSLSLYFSSVATSALCQVGLLWVKLSSPKGYVAVLAPCTSKCDLMWSWGHCKCS